MNRNYPSVSLDGFTLKYVALFTMTLDHIAAVLLPYGSTLYTLFRGLGRIAFPLYCLLLVEGFLHTSNWKKYFGRLLIFALLSELPFDMALFHFPYVRSASVLFGHQNVFFTLAFSLLAIHFVDLYWLQKPLLGLSWLALIAVLAEFLHFDYGLTGVLIVFILFYIRKYRPSMSPVLLGFFAVLPLFSPSSVSGISVLLAIPFLALYNGEKGSPLPGGRTFPGAKYLFYIYYPVHLLVISVVYFFS